MELPVLVRPSDKVSVPQPNLEKVKDSNNESSDVSFIVDFSQNSVIIEENSSNEIN